MKVATEILIFLWTHKHNPTGRHRERLTYTEWHRKKTWTETVTDQERVDSGGETDRHTQHTKTVM